MDNQHDISIDDDGDHTDEPILYNLFNQNPSHNQDNDHNCNSNSNSHFQFVLLFFHSHNSLIR